MYYTWSCRRRSVPCYTVAAAADTAAAGDHLYPAHLRHFDDEAARYGSRDVIWSRVMMTPGRPGHRLLGEAD